MGRLVVLISIFMVTISLTTVATAQTCETLFRTAVDQTAMLNMALERADDMIVSLVEGRNRFSPDTLVAIELSQDLSHIKKLPIPRFVLTMMARKALAKKFQARHPDRDKHTLPRVLSMWFDANPNSFRGVDVTLRSRIVVDVTVGDLAELITTFAETVHHPALGNQIFKIALATQTRPK